jgi:hypothetical protein
MSKTKQRSRGAPTSADLDQRMLAAVAEMPELVVVPAAEYWNDQVAIMAKARRWKSKYLCVVPLDMYGASDGRLTISLKGGLSAAGATRKAVRLKRALEDQGLSVRVSGAMVHVDCASHQ